jgi:hypothetical protein
VTFIEAAGQEVNFSGPTTEQWQVSFAGSTQLGPLMSTPSHGFTPWHSVKLTFTVPAASTGSEVLTFLALGTPSGIPPIAFLDDVGVNVVPEPGSLAVVGIGLLGSVVAGRLHRAKSRAGEVIDE